MSTILPIQHITNVGTIHSHISNFVDLRRFAMVPFFTEHADLLEPNLKRISNNSFFKQIICFTQHFIVRLGKK